MGEGRTVESDGRTQSILYACMIIAIGNSAQQNFKISETPAFPPTLRIYKQLIVAGGGADILLSAVATGKLSTFLR